MLKKYTPKEYEGVEECDGVTYSQMVQKKIMCVSERRFKQM